MPGRPPYGSEQVPAQAVTQPPAQVPVQTPASAGAGSEPAVSLSDFPLVRLVDNMFRDWNPLERAVAVENGSSPSTRSASVRSHTS